MYLTQLQNTCVFTIGGIGRTAHQCGQGGCKPVPDQGTVQTGVFNQIFTDRCGNGGHVTDMLHHGCKRDGCHYQNGGDVEFAQRKFGHAYHGGSRDICKIQNCRAVCICHTHCIENQSRNIGNDNAHQDRDNLKHALAPDIENNDGCKRDKGKQPVCGGIADSGACQTQTDTDDNRACYNRGKKTHNLFYTD